MSVPAAVKRLEEMSATETRRSKSFDDDSDLDLCYSEDVSASTSPSAALHVPFVPRKIEGAPRLPVGPSQSALDISEGGRISSVGPKEKQSSFEYESSRLIIIDFDLSEEEDHLSEDEEANRRISYDTAPLPKIHSDLDIGNTHTRSVSLTDAIATSPMVSINSKGDDDLLNLTMPSISPVPMRRVSSTPFQLESWNSQKTATPHGRKRLDSLHTTKPRVGGSPKHACFSSPYAMRRQASMPVTGREHTAPAIQFTGISERLIDGGAGIFRTAGRRGVVASPSGRRKPSPLRAKTTTAPTNGGRIPSPSRIPGGLQSVPAQTRNENPEKKKLPLSSPYPFRRQMSLPVTAGERIKSAADERDVASDCRDQRTDSIFSDGGTDRPTLPLLSNGLLSPSDSLVTSEKRQGIVRAQDSHADNSEEERSGGTASPDAEVNSEDNRLYVEDAIDGGTTEPSTSSKEQKDLLFQRQKLLYVAYLSVFSIFGSSIREFLVLIFAGCELPGYPYGDDLCITTSGMTAQRGGALFADLPPNMLGCFIMGLVTSLKPDVWPPLPWLGQDNPLQRFDAYHVGIRTGLCGTITTFSSWNSQMIVMMDGTLTELGPQVVTALFGYLIGFFCALASFLVGTHVSAWLTRWRNPDIAEEDDEELRLNTARSIDHGDDYEHHQSSATETVRSRHLSSTRFSSPQGRIIIFPLFLISRFSCCFRRFCNGRAPFVLLAILLTGYGVAGFSYDNSFYRTLFWTSVFTPPGALLRWELTKWGARVSDQRWRRLNWFPLGTFVANVLGSCVCIVLLAIEARYFLDNAQEVAFLTALRVGFTGSLSTVSTMVKEMCELQSKFPYHAKAYHYASLTVVTCIGLCLLLYSPIVRSK